jgi:hypothetical protein
MVLLILIITLTISVTLFSHKPIGVILTVNLRVLKFLN